MKKLLFLLASMPLFFSCCNNDKAAVANVQGEWMIEEAMSKSTQGGDSETVIVFNEDGTVGGNTSINSFSGEYKQEGENLTFSNIGLTQAMGESVEIEQAVVEAINNVASIKMTDDKLEILNKDGNTVLVLKKK